MNASLLNIRITEIILARCSDNGTTFYKQTKEVEFRQNIHNILSLHLTGNSTISISINKGIYCYLKTGTINRIFIFYMYNIRM